ncbi:2285_t:CDS:2, partial [Scutellospora calospora]
GLIESLNATKKVCADFRKYVLNGVLFHQYLVWSKRQNGTAVGFITEAREALHQLTKCKSPTIAAHAVQEYKEVNELYNIYVGINDTVTFQVVPSKADLQALIPGGRTSVDLIEYTPPAPVFGPGVDRTSKSESGYILKNHYY